MYVVCCDALICLHLNIYIDLFVDSFFCIYTFVDKLFCNTCIFRALAFNLPNNLYKKPVWQIQREDIFTWKDSTKDLFMLNIIYNLCSIHMTGKTKTIFSYSSDISGPLLHPCTSLPHPPPQALLQQVHPIHSHRPLHESHKGYAEHSMSVPFKISPVWRISFHEATAPSLQCTKSIFNHHLCCADFFVVDLPFQLAAVVVLGNDFKSQYCKR